LRPAAAALALAGLIVLTAWVSDRGASNGSALAASTGGTAEIGTLPAAARAIIDKPVYDSARWIYYVADAATGEALLANRPDEMVFTGSTAKLFVIGSVFATLGPDTTLTTPVFSTTPAVNGVVSGDVVLVASGDIALGGRNALEGRVDHTFTATAVDHVYGDIAPNATRVGDPLAGLDKLSHDIASRGVTRIDGDVVIDTSIWTTFEGLEGPTPPIFVNDNILDIEVTAAGVGEPATIATTPQTNFFTVTSDVETVAAGGETALAVEPSTTDPNSLVVSGTIAAGHSQLTIFRVPDAAAWARALFIEALQRAGITVSARPHGPNDQSGLPASRNYPPSQQLASLTSPTLAAIGTMIQQTSYNTGANDFMCLLAVQLSSTDCTDGLKTEYAFAAEAGVDTDHLFLVDGQGQDPASTTPRQIARWVQWAREQSWGDAFVATQPVLGVSGTLASSGGGTPAAGKVAAKTGTSVAADMVTGRLYAKVQCVAGYITLDDGRTLVFGLFMSGATYPDLLGGLTESGQDVALVSGAFQQGLSR
jgi:D-alanyl-D-alanine carboxypeptidase/D-alanyl-D-alanine-endopeptidase (penicillin-binding protein 4)